MSKQCQKYSYQTEQITAKVMPGTFPEMDGKPQSNLRMQKHCLQAAYQFSHHKVLKFQMSVQEMTTESFKPV